MVARDTSSFEAWYREEHPHVVTAMLLVTGDLDATREAVDEVFARALERWERVSTFEFPTAWTYRVAMNVARRSWRRRAIERRILQRTQRPDDVPPPAGELWQIVATLPLRQRQVIVLRYLADLPEQEIADVLGISRGNVARTLFGAHARLEELLAIDSPFPPQEVPNVAT